MNNKLVIETQDGYVSLSINKKHYISAIVRPYDITIEQLLKPCFISNEEFYKTFNIFIKECMYEYTSIKHVQLDCKIKTNLKLNELFELGFEIGKAIK